MSRDAKAGKELGKHDRTWRRKILRSNRQGITKTALRRLARSGGVERISGIAYEDADGVLPLFVGKVASASLQIKGKHKMASKRTLAQTGGPRKHQKTKGLLTYHIATADSSLTSQAFQNRALVDACIADIENKLHKKPPVFVFGKWRQQPRNVGFFSDDSVGYKYSGQLMESQPLSEALKAILKDINELYTGADFNGILVNEYGDGNDCIGSHSDDEKGLSKVGVVSLSIGATRKFRIRSKSSKKIVADVATVPYTLLHMAGKFQREFTHEIPKEKRIKDRRVSFTFRKHLK